MQAHEQATTNGQAPFPAERVGSSAELTELRVAYKRQAHVIETLTEAVSRLRTGVTALKADNTDLRGELDRLRGFDRVRGAASSSELAEVADIRLGVEAQAPAVARAVLGSALSDRVPALVIEHAQLLASELVTNSVLYCGASPDDVLVFRVQLSSAVVRLEVEDPGRGGTISPRLPDLIDGGGFGLNVVGSLSESWGVERLATGTRVWAQLGLDAGVDPGARPRRGECDHFNRAKTRPGGRRRERRLDPSW
jgi:serine/threonine-protein kinase RsbW